MAPAAPGVNENGPGKSPDGVTPLLRVGGCLSAHWRRWQSIGASSWVLSVLRDSYRIPFLDSPPPLSRYPVSFPMYRAGSPRSLALRQEIEKMLSKDAPEIVLDLGPGFYSRLFLVEKVTGSWRPVIDLSHLSGFVRLTPFKMETVASVLLSVREGNFLASIILKDAYFQIPVHPSSRKLLRFLSEGTVDCPTGLHQGVRRCVCVGPLPRDLSAAVPGRLAGPCLFGGGGHTERPGPSLALSLTRDSDKRWQVRSRSLADAELPGYDHRYRGRQDLPVSCASREISIGGGDVLCFDRSPRSALAGALGSPGFAGEAGPARSPLNALPAVAFEDVLVPRVRFSFPSGVPVPRGVGGPVLVDGAGSSCRGGSIQDTCSRSTPVLGRSRSGWGTHLLN